LEIIEYDISKLSTERKRSNPMQEKILAACYLFMAKLVCNKLNYQNLLLEDNSKLFFAHLNSYGKFPTHLLLRELYRNNKD